MIVHSPQEVTQLLRAWCSGDKTALDRLIPLIHDELQRLAHRHMRRERVGHTLQTTALVNEAYLRLVDANQVPWQNRAHFFAKPIRQRLRPRPATPANGGLSRLEGRPHPATGG